MNYAHANREYASLVLYIQLREGILTAGLSTLYSIVAVAFIVGRGEL